MKDTIYDTNPARKLHIVGPALGNPSFYKSLTATLRKILRARKITYADVGRSIRVSEQTIKRLFASSDGSVGRLVEVASVVGLSFGELVALAEDERERTFLLSEEQERHFCEAP